MLPNVSATLYRIVLFCINVILVLIVIVMVMAKLTLTVTHTLKFTLKVQLNHNVVSIQIFLTRIMTICMSV